MSDTAVRCLDPDAMPHAGPETIGAEPPGTSEHTPAYTAELIRAARAEALELWPNFSVTPEQVEILLDAALAKAARDLDAGREVHLEYLGRLRRLELSDGPLVIFRADPDRLEVL